MRVLVTGATSLLGRAVVTRLQERGNEVTAFQRSPSGLGVNEHLGDIADRAAVAAAVQGCEAIVHLAARALAVAVGPWEEYEKTNVRGTQNVIDAAREFGVGRLVYVSSPSVANYGNAVVGASACPTDPDRTRGHYARSKAQAELLALAVDSSDLAVVAIRPHLIWGPGDTQLVGRIVSRAREGRLVVVGSGAALIDTTYTDNAADSLVAALDRAPTLGGRALVVTNGQPRSVRELMNRIVLAAGLPVPRLKVPARMARTGGLVAERIWERQGREDDPPMTSFVAEQLSTAHWFDQRETRRLLGWEPAVSLDQGFQRLREWFAAGGDGPTRP